MKRIKSKLDSYHIVQNGAIERYAKKDIFLDDEDRLQFLKILTSVTNDKFNLITCCLMDNHIHMLVHGKSIEIVGKSICIIKTNYSKYIRKKYNDKSIKIFSEEKYYCKPIDTEIQFWNTLKYILRNPVEAGVSNSYDYQWSSYSAYFDIPNPEWAMIDTQKVRSRFSSKYYFENFLKSYEPEYVKFYREISYKKLTEEQQQILKERKARHTGLN